jgi:triosephosphate isomerase
MKNIIAANWKMHFDINEAENVAKEMADSIDTDKAEIIVCANFTHLDRLNKIFNKGAIKLGAQNMYFEEKGAFTGEVSPSMLTSVGCEYVILGHSERRHIFKEDDKLINKKTKKAIEHGLTPIVCAGETLDDRNSNKAFLIIENQLRESLMDIDLDKVVIAYEPVWAIGTGVAADSKTIDEIHNFIRSLALHTPILYGGSVKPANSKELAAIKNVDGFLVGGASLIPHDFKNIIDNFISTKGE